MPDLPRRPILTAAAILRALEEEAAEGGVPTFPELLERLYADKFQGPVTLHFAGGLPRRVEFPRPVQVDLLPLPKK
jgi:hypothetical protein